MSKVIKSNKEKEKMELKKEREELVEVLMEASEAVTYSIDDENANVGKLYAVKAKAKKALQEFDATHPEIIAQIREEKTAREQAMRETEGYKRIAEWRN